ncbi:hypothetical protein WM019_06295 [Bifidobacterium mongoliense]|uniref:hypothetical protein n=1 Tax=Bifidobacterium mongoliense TaxID=518643 RepID=UPI0030ED79E7
MAAAVLGRMPIITNSAAPRMKAPEASASRLFFIPTPCVPWRRMRAAQGAGASHYGNKKGNHHDWRFPY